MPPSSMASKTDVNGQLQHGWLLRFIVLKTIPVVRDRHRKLTTVPSALEPILQ